jgi:hypothetical protein
MPAMLSASVDAAILRHRERDSAQEHSRRQHTLKRCAVGVQFLEEQLQGRGIRCWRDAALAYAISTSSIVSG